MRQSNDIRSVLVRYATRAMIVVMSAAGAGRLQAAEPEVKAATVGHKIMVCEYSDKAHRLVELGADGKTTWEHKFPSIAVCFRPAGEGRIAFADGGSPTGIIVVDRDHKTVFDYRAKCEQVLNCDVLPNGNILLAEQGPCQAVEVNAKGEVVSTVRLTTSEKPAHRQIRCIHRLENGHYLASHEGEGAVREYDAQGKIVWEYTGVPNTYESLRLKDGNTLIACGTDKRVIEVTPEKKIVWELKASDAPELNLTWITSLQILKNGNFMIANFLRGQEGKGAHAFEVTHDKEKKIVWKYAAHDVVRSITMVRAMDDK